MKEYEVFVEDINPCGGTKYGNRKMIEIEAESPEAYVESNGRFPIIEKGVNAEGDVVITTGDGKGSFVKYTFME